MKYFSLQNFDLCGYLVKSVNNFKQRMIVQKLINFQKKQLTNKQPYKKPKYKTYRQLLELDKPKKMIEEQSDGENDDFLQKLLRQEKKKKKKPTRNKSRASQKIQQIVKLEKKEEIAIQRQQNNEELPIIIKQAINDLDIKNTEEKLNPQDFVDTNRSHHLNSVWKTQSRNSNKQILKDKQKINNIYIDDGNTQANKVLSYGFTTKSSKLKKAAPTNALKQILSKGKIMRQFEHNINSSNKIVHIFKNAPTRIMSRERIIYKDMLPYKRRKNSQQKPMFKNQEQQIIFLKNLMLIDDSKRRKI